MTTILVINPTSGRHRSQLLLYNFGDVERLLKILHRKCQMKTRKSRTNITLFLNEIRDWFLPPITIEIIKIRSLQKRYCGSCQHKSLELESDFLHQLNKTKTPVLRVSAA